MAKHTRHAQLHPVDGGENKARPHDPPAAQQPGPDQRVAEEAGRERGPEEGGQRDYDARGEADGGQGGGGAEEGRRCG